MLNKIYIQNFALIDKLSLNLNKGLQVITGETGAGKSIILGALRLILGERADLKAVADAEQKSVVEAEFEVSNDLKSFFDENDLDFENLTIIRREILPSGKSRAFVNDVPVTLDVLKNLSSKLVDIHSQFETSLLFTEAYQFKIIDGIAQNQSILAEYQKTFSAYQNLKKDLEEAQNHLSEGLKERDYKSFLLQELEELALDKIDFEEIKNQLNTQENAEFISENLAAVISRFHQEEIGVLDALADAKTKLYRVSEASSQFDEVSQRLDSVFEEFKDIVSEVENQVEKIEMNPHLLSELTTIVNKINTLFVKHQVDTVEDLLAIKNKLSEEQNSFDTLEQRIGDITQKLEQSLTQLETLSKELSSTRVNASLVFKDKIEQLLKQLGLEKAKIEVSFSEVETFNSFGKESINILFQANTGFPLKPIQSAISGGERSRVMLSVKKIMAETTALPTLILDEIDTGVSGRVAEEIGKVMKEMAKDMQLIVITHLAQVAAKGHHNYKVVKSEVEGRTQSRIISLSEDEKLHEIAQILSGAKITDAALEQAKELMK
ncbi:DNA repair protein RecN [Riemerella anatipestifer]|uniref:DNA repair protein RecN n=1 Tax=Riemerella anatipestifer (strain ATCC 11845 / DSM 15868 / JCM 9532 / NCTC 11014) TaxID=693978 RepID=E4TCG6_RIEAD|nr:DNA repair protein RecN [Riemerella anatipestifer]ADQ82475.1 DNA replication and repair protein RecN [Riemerella anatipestifer ATCC 11845 = DSM 15868]AFD56481.1 DNA replication and repair protein recn [Riemerella anatipestifer ATCC 11845 = DSM 15868]MRM92921.1 DNA repair protein RecN [Riemerella anatipestifer]MSN89545.1 DNA repair protein RecN [Riemerella anatipestifer]SNV64115.1 Recombination protein N [Riemerella anatipestifer]